MRSHPCILSTPNSSEGHVESPRAKNQKPRQWRRWPWHSRYRLGALASCRSQGHRGRTRYARWQQVTTFTPLSEHRRGTPTPGSQNIRRSARTLGGDGCPNCSKSVVGPLAGKGEKRRKRAKTQPCGRSKHEGNRPKNMTLTEPA